MSTVVIIGEGMLADMVCRRLSGFSVARRSDFSEGIPDGAELVLVLQEQDRSDLHLEADAALRPLGIPWLCAYVFLGEGVVGPIMRPGTTGCFQCAETRLSLAGSNRKEVEEMLMKLVTPDYVPEFAADISPAGFRYMAHIIAEDAGKVLRGGTANAEGHIYIINFSNLSGSLHYVLPNGTCPVCGRLPDDSPEAAEITLKPSPKLHNSYRCRSMSELRESLFQDYWDSRIGILNDKKIDLVSAFAGAAVNLPLGYYDEVTGGRSHSYADSQLAAILEGLERFCGTTPRGKRTVVFDSYSRLKDTAMDPSKAGFHAREQFELPDFSFTPFDPEAPMEWVWGYSFLQERPILVPHLLAYYSLGYGEGFVYETSNGCAVGGSLEEAILYGIFEVVERDSFLMTWYARLPVPRLDPDSSGDRELSIMLHRLRAVTGYEVLLYNTTMENGIPSIWAIAKGGAEHQVNLVCAAGAHLDPVRAAKGAIHELSGIISMTEERWRRRKPEAEAMFEDSFQVQQMEDHALLYSLPQAEERLRFLLDERRPVRTFAEEFPSVPAHTDLTADLQQVLQVFHSLELDVIVVDQSSSETLRNGLHCVKVLIPGMLPMTFGHHLRRLEGLDRVLEVPMRLGYADRRLTPQELNPYPHPFP
ncbi:TOMM precursor leader peptide-binding protein [Paenibacillus thiaminolyticus]|uniref:TOMM precursor leader peptide-binding protein n=1 Tax=Paenibacillus thiaminolyticus TaxID=49283 RepID=UPI002543B912|nr:TOMM precursor leader peptide-binding protein [Paenibacillus thiaminolyticus]WII39108.1 TOMM precursor leader peptide-binding protein [Paenibacillus thiaminolyticus]